MKYLLCNVKDPCMALLIYHAMSLQWCGLSAAELLMHHKIKTDLPQLKNNFSSTWIRIHNLKALHESISPIKRTTKANDVVLKP